MPIHQINSIIKPEVSIVPCFRDVIKQTIESFNCEITKSNMVNISYNQIHELYAIEISEERIPDYEQLRCQFEFGKSEIIEISTDQDFEVTREMIVGSLGKLGIRGAFENYRTAEFWNCLGYQSSPNQSNPAWWRYNAMHMPRNSKEQQRLSEWINRHNFNQ